MTRNSLRNLLRHQRAGEEKVLWHKYCNVKIKKGGFVQDPDSTCPEDMRFLLVLPRKQAISIMVLAEELHLVLVLMFRDIGSGVYWTYFSPPCAAEGGHRQFFNMASQMISPQTMRWSVAESFLHRGEPFTEDTQPFPEFAPEDYSGEGGETMCLDDLLWQDSRNIPLVSLNLCTIEMDCTFGTTAEQQEGDAAGSTGAYADGVGKDGNNNSLVWCVAGGVRLHACTLIGARHGALVSCTMRDAFTRS